MGLLNLKEDALHRGQFLVWHIDDEATVSSWSMQGRDAVDETKEVCVHIVTRGRKGEGKRRQSVESVS